MSSDLRRRPPRGHERGWDLAARKAFLVGCEQAPKRAGQKGRLVSDLKRLDSLPTRQLFVIERTTAFFYGIFEATDDSSSCH